MIAIPTETVYGLAANAFDEKAVDKIYQLKNRPKTNPLILHVDSKEKLEALVSEIPVAIHTMIDLFTPGPITFLLPKKEIVPDYITAGKERVGVRIPSHPLLLKLLSTLDFPLAAPSANPSNRVSATSVAHVIRYFEGKIPMVLDGGSCEKGLESTIVGWENEQLTVYRVGAISTEEIENATNLKVHFFHSMSGKILTPGMMNKHYSPITPLKLTDNLQFELDKSAFDSIGVLSFSNEIIHPKVKKNVVLSKKGDLQEAAKNLYKHLIELDEIGVDVIIAEKLPNFGLGRTINDRLERASHKE